MLLLDVFPVNLSILGLYDRSTSRCTPACEGLHFTATSGTSPYTTFSAVQTVATLHLTKVQAKENTLSKCKSSPGIDIRTSTNRRQCARSFSCLNNGAKQGCLALYDLLFLERHTDAVTQAIVDKASSNSSYTVDK